jgi:VanZ family protein
MFFHGIFLPWLRRIGRWCFWPALAVVAWGELTPHPPSMAEHVWDKAEHFTAYFGLALLATLAWGLKRSLIWIYLGIAALGGALEILQFYTGRDGDWHDELANCLGAATGMGLAALYLVIPRRLVDGPPRD